MATFDGTVYDNEADRARLTGQLKRVFDLMLDAKWRTLAEISAATSAPQASVSAQLRNLRKKRFGEHTVNKRPRGDRRQGLYEYQLLAHEQRGT